MAAPVAFDMTPTPPAEVRPTISGRIAVYDLIRGVAILGILLANIPYFAGPAFSREFGGGETLAGWEAALESVRVAFVSGKFRPMLAILFGIGIWLQYRTRSQIPGNWPGGYLKRMMFLALFGLVHGFLIWFGDILFLYSMVAFIVCLFAGFSDRVLWWIFGFIVSLALLFGLGIAGLAAVMPKELLEGPGLEQMGITVAREIAVFRTGSYLDQLGFRALAFAISAASMAVYVPFLGGIFVFGLLLGRHGVLAAPENHPKWTKWMLGIGFGLGLPLNLLAFAPLPPGGLFIMRQAVEIGFGAIFAAGILMVLALWSRSGFLATVQSAIAKVGRTAFSNYILQSLLCSALFYSWGFGLFGKLDRAAELMAVPAIWAVNLIFAHFWLKKYTMGPLEWLWRSLTEGKKQPWRLEETGRSELSVTAPEQQNG
jgi:uncharacterized protein